MHFLYFSSDYFLPMIFALVNFPQLNKKTETNAMFLIFQNYLVKSGGQNFMKIFKVNRCVAGNKLVHSALTWKNAYDNRTSFVTK